MGWWVLSPIGWLRCPTSKPLGLVNFIALFRSLPSLEIRTTLLKILCDLPNLEQGVLRQSGLGKAVMYLKKHPREVKENVQRAAKLIREWSRPIFQLEADFNSMTREERFEMDSEMSKRRRLVFIWDSQILMHFSVAAMTVKHLRRPSNLKARKCWIQVKLDLSSVQECRSHQPKRTSIDRNPKSTVLFTELRKPTPALALTLHIESSRSVPRHRVLDVTSCQTSPETRWVFEWRVIVLFIIVDSMYLCVL